MPFIYSRESPTLTGRLIERFFEMVPGGLSWGLLIGFFSLCFFVPVAGVVAVILFDIYWLMRLVYFTLFLVLSYALLEVERTAKWPERLGDLTDIDGAIGRTKKRLRGLFFFTKARLSEKRHRATLLRIQRRRLSFPDPKEIVQLVIIPFYREGMPILRRTAEALAGADYPKKQMVVVFGVEERAGRVALEIAETLKREYGETFLHFEICVHPDRVPGEAAVKGANATHAARWAERFFKSRGIPFENILVSCFDCDTVVSPEYFACLTYTFLAQPDRTQTSFQPVPVYHNNLWEAPPIARVIETSSSFFQLIEATEPETLVTFSSHSMSFKALVEVGFWPADLVSDDSAIFWKAFLAYDGRYRVTPLYVTLSMDVVVGKNFWETCSLIYRQKRRWAWGVENFPIFMRGLLSNPRIPLGLKLKQAFRLLEMNVSWAVWSPIMLIFSWMPVLVVSYEFTRSVAHFNAPRVAGIIFNLASATLLISIILSLLLLPKRTHPVSFFRKVGFALTWLLLPMVATIFGSLPALDAQTRLLLGRYMEFFVTPKGEQR